MRKLKLLLRIFFVLIFTTQAFAQSITVMSPNGGERWEANSSQNIRWESNKVDKIRIEYSLDNGLSWREIVKSIEASKGEYNWRVTNAKAPYVFIA